MYASGLSTLHHIQTDYPPCTRELDNLDRRDKKLRNTTTTRPATNPRIEIEERSCLLNDTRGWYCRGLTEQKKT